MNITYYNHGTYIVWHAKAALKNKDIFHAGRASGVRLSPALRSAPGRTIDNVWPTMDNGRHYSLADNLVHQSQEVLVWQ
jgi:hypothetical protein